jgi:hypothetical protein
MMYEYGDMVGLYWQGKTQYRLDKPDLSPNSGLCGERPATNRLRTSMCYMQPKEYIFKDKAFICFVGCIYE